MLRLLVLFLVVAAGVAAGSAVARLLRPRVPLPPRVPFALPRCSHCGARQQQGLRMIAGRRAYICERCLRRGVELLDAPDDITRFL